MRPPLPMQLLLLLSATAAASAAATAAAASAARADEIFHICKRNDPQLNECVVQTIQELVPLLKKGIPQLKIPSHEPLLLPRAEIKQGSGPVTIDSTFTDQVIRGITNLRTTAVRADLDNGQLELDFQLPYLDISGNYKIEGRILLLPIRGSGDSRSNYTGVSGTAALRGHPETRNGRTYLEPDEFKFDMQVQKAKIRMNNLFNGDKQLGETMNRFLEENWEVMYREVKPVVDQSISELMLDSARKVFGRFPLDELFPPE